MAKYKKTQSTLHSIYQNDLTKTNLQIEDQKKIDTLQLLKLKAEIKKGKTVINFKRFDLWHWIKVKFFKLIWPLLVSSRIAGKLKSRKPRKSN